MDEIWLKRFDMVLFLGKVALGSPVCVIVALLTQGNVRPALVCLAVGLFVPVFLYVYVVIIWHWKARYRGEHSDLWGAVLLIETSGWTKAIYLFRHLIPNMRRTGRYLL